jgi:hypothetical protein
VFEDIDLDDLPLRLAELRLGGRPVRGNWTCLDCGETVVDWTAYACQVIRYRLRLAAWAVAENRLEDE